MTLYDGGKPQLGGTAGAVPGDARLTQDSQPPSVKTVVLSGHTSRHQATTVHASQCL